MRLKLNSVVTDAGPTRTSGGGAKPFVKVSGGKRKLVPLIKEVMPNKFGSYHEPFVGGGALFFNLQPKKAFLSDLNAKLINVYLALREDVEQVVKKLKKLQYDPRVFQKVREHNFERGDMFQQAADYIYANKSCFNGIYRVNQSGQFNVPFGRYTNPTICDEEGLYNAGKALQGVTIRWEPFEKVLGRAKKGDFVYFDPPYAPISATSDFTSFTKQGFGSDDQVKLRDVALELKKRGVHVVLSNSNASLIRDLYCRGANRKNFLVREIKAARSINSDGEKRGDVTELLIY